MNRYLFVWALSLVLSMQALAIDFGARTWTNTAGKEIKAQLVRADEQSAHLKLAANGKIVPVPLASLSEADRAYAQAWVDEKKAAWGIEVVKAEACDSFKVPKKGSKEVIKPEEGSGLFVLEIKITPPAGLALPMFDDIQTILVLEGGKAAGEAVAKYVRPRRPGDTKPDEPGEGIILYQIPKGARALEIRYKDNPPIPVVSKGPVGLLDRR